MTPYCGPSSPSTRSVSHDNLNSTREPDTELENEASTVTGALLRPKLDGLHVVEKRNSSASSSAPRPSAWQTHIINGWMWECFCGFFAIGALVAMVAVLATAQGKSISTWGAQHYHLSINAVIAVLSTLLKGSSMLIVTEVLGQTKWQWFESIHELNDFNRLDSASRGPLGSAKLLHWVRGPKIALLGAFITVIALAVDPFTQNIVALNGCPVLSTNRTILMPTSDYYEKFSSRHVGSDPGEFRLWGITWSTLDPAMKAAIYSGLYSPATDVINASSVHAVCPGYNCTFPKYTTMAICHKCADISSSVATSCDQTATSTDNNGTQSPCTWSLSNGQVLKSYTDEEILFNPPNGDAPLQNFVTVNSTSVTEVLGNIPGTFSNVSILANVSSDSNCTIDQPNACLDLPIGYPRMPFKTIAVECSLFPCTRTYTAAVIDGTVIETEVERSFGEGDWMETWRSDGPRPSDIVISPQGDCVRTIPWTGDNSSCTFTASQNFITAAGTFFWHFWNGTVSGRIFREGVSSSEVVEIMYNKGITNYTYLDEILGSISDSMTAAIRLAKRLPEESLRDQAVQGIVEGEVYVLDTCIRVRWGWIALPATVAWLSLLLLIFTLFSSRANGRPAWKSSSLPVLFHGLSVDIHTSKQLSTISEMEEEARHFRVTLRENHRGHSHLDLTT